MEIANDKKKSQRDCEMLLNYNSNFKRIFIEAIREKKLYRIVMLSSIHPLIKKEYLNNLPRIKLIRHNEGSRFRIVRKKRSQ
jgi:hypothetical protein